MINFFTWVGGFTMLALLASATVFGLGWAIDFVTKVRDFRLAESISEERDNLSRSCEELMNERDQLRDEINMLRTATPYRGPSLVATSTETKR